MQDFDIVIDRKDSTKWKKYKDTGVLPMWIADMDFKAPQAVSDLLKVRSDLGDFGYTDAPNELRDVIVERLRVSYDWTIERNEILFIPGVVSGLNTVCRAWVKPDESIITAAPIYPPFLEAPATNGRELIKIDTDPVGGDYHYPLFALRNAITSKSRLLLLCNPFNPIGRVLSFSELREIVDICLDHHLLICSDEIHCDLVFDGRTHIPLAKVDERIEQSLVTLISPGKTYNIAGIGGGIAIIKNKSLREKFLEASHGVVGDVSLFSYAAMLAAYRDCESWRKQVINYLQDNRNYCENRVEKIPGIKMNKVEATYLAWLDVRGLKLDDALSFFEEAGVGLSDGEDFGGPGFMRLNFGCPRAILTEAWDRIAWAVDKHFSNTH